MADRLQVLVDSRIDPFENRLIMFVSAFDMETQRGFQASASIPVEEMQSLSAQAVVTKLIQSLNESIRGGITDAKAR